MSLDPLEHDTRLYTDIKIALRILGCTYREYIQRTTPWERRLIMLFLTLEHAKDEHAEARAARDRDAERMARQAGPGGGMR